MFKKDAIGNEVVHKNIRMTFYKEEVDWVAENLYRPRIVNDAARNKAVNAMIMRFLRNPRKDPENTWIVDIRDPKFRSLAWNNPYSACRPAPDKTTFLMLEGSDYLIYRGSKFILER